MTIIEQRVEIETRELRGLEREDLGNGVGVAFEFPALDTINHVDAGIQEGTAQDEQHMRETDEWEALASCRAVDNASELFFSEELTDIVAAKRVCADCPVIAPCLEGAIRRAEPCGVWGGQLFANGRVLAQKRRRGRPPKVARPEDQLPVIPVPEHLQKLIA